MTPLFQTQNTALAVTLATCGVPFDQHPRTGQPMPFLNYYSREILLGLGYKNSGLSLDDAARDAWQKGRCGLLVYVLQKVDPFEAVVKAFDEHSSMIARADEAAGRAGMQPLSALRVAPEIAAQICCQFAKNRKVMTEGWRTAIPWILLPGDVTTTRESGVEYRVGSMKLYQLGASADTKAKIGI